MELSRRDALTALTAAGITATAGCSSLLDEDSTDAETDGETSPMGTMVALGEVLYPSDVEVTGEFIETYLFGRITDEEGYREELAAGIETLNSEAEAVSEDGFAALSADERVAVIEETDLRTGESVPDGSAIERVNYYLIDELLFAFYSSPTGGELVGNTNPRGWPGGFGYSPEVPE